MGHSKSCGSQEGGGSKIQSQALPFKGMSRPLHWGSSRSEVSAPHPSITQKYHLLTRNLQPAFGDSDPNLQTITENSRRKSEGLPASRRD